MINETLQIFPLNFELGQIFIIVKIAERDLQMGRMEQHLCVVSLHLDVMNCYTNLVGLRKGIACNVAFFFYSPNLV